LRLKAETTRFFHFAEKNMRDTLFAERSTVQLKFSSRERELTNMVMRLKEDLGESALCTGEATYFL
jgi:hypothetical protein